MFRFDRALILPLFLSRQITITELAKKAGTSHLAAWRAVNGENVNARIVGKISTALGISAEKFLVRPSTPVIF